RENFFCCARDEAGNTGRRLGTAFLSVRAATPTSLQLQVHLHQRFLHVLDMGRGAFERAFAFSQLAT
ncbi:hypothetical protein, partial [Trinickia mobilis]|uniref:hypothetical protein n=1 Tax=Trinickia mobilis TaxID=2816356 RepID=UPI001A8DA6AD